MTTPADSEMYLDLCRQIAEVRSTFKAKHRVDSQALDEEIQGRIRQKEPLLNLQKLKPDQALHREFVARFLPLLEKHNVFDQNQIRAFRAEQGRTDLTPIVCAILSKQVQDLKSISAEYQVGTDFLLFLGLNLAQVELELHADELKNRVDQETWLKGVCPVCGSLPAIQRLVRDDGRRMLRCSLCSTEWYFKRVMCPFCENEDHNTLRYFFVDESSPIDKPAFRVDVCDKCKSYIKTLDERKLPESEKPDLYVENLSTLYLDMLAQRDGYKSPTYWMIGPSEDLFV
jgi:FdhE protein